MATEGMRFGALYGFCLGACLSGIQLALGWIDPPPAVEVVSETSAFVALPPKPDGAREAGDGEGVVYTEEGCLAYTGDVRDACFHALALQRAGKDAVGGQAACERIGEDPLRWECIADVAELYWPADRATSEAICPTIGKKKWRDQCWFNLALAASRIDYDYARRMCGEAGMWRDFCYHDVNGEIAQVEPAAALAWCDLEQGELLRRKTCYHGLGKYLGRTDPGAARGICEQVPTSNPLYPENCHHGIGWAMAETRGSAALEDCSKSGKYRDSCTLGVSAHAKRLDRGEALRICGEVSRDDLRQRCEAFANR